MIPQALTPAKAVIGMDYDDAVEVLLDLGWQYRIAEVDGAKKVLTRDYVKNRLNLVLQDWKVERVWMG